MFPFLTQLFLYGFCIDAVFSFWSELYQIQSGSLFEIRALIAFSALSQGMILYIFSAFTKKISFRLVGWPTVFLLWANLTAGFPLPLLYLPTAGVWLSGAQVLIAFGLIGASWRSNAVGGGPGFVDPAEGRSGFEWRRFLIFAGVNLVFLPLLALGTFLGGMIQTLEKSTAGYVRLRPSGLYITQSSFKKDAHVVALDGMMHVADGNFYEKLKWGVEGAKTLVLLEGVTDKDHLLVGGLGMDKLAKFFGLESQMDRGEYRDTLKKMAAKQEAGEQAGDGTIALDKTVDVRMADVDINTFRPQTISYLKAVAELFQSVQNGKMDDLVKIMEANKAVLQNEKVAQGAMDDVLKGRNTYLIQQIETGLQTHNRIVVPWGAMHLAGIEEYLRSKGFAELDRVEKPAVLFWKK